jgi:hypothetical protein
MSRRFSNMLKITFPCKLLYILKHIWHMSKGHILISVVADIYQSCLQTVYLTYFSEQSHVKSFLYYLVVNLHRVLYGIVLKFSKLNSP